MQAMLSFLKAQRKKQHAVIIDDISRLARGLMAHFELRVKIPVHQGVAAILNGVPSHGQLFVAVGPRREQRSTNALGADHAYQLAHRIEEILVT